MSHNDYCCGMMGQYAGDACPGIEAVEQQARVRDAAPRMLAMLEEILTHDRLLLTRGVVAGHRYSEAEKRWIADPATTTFVKARQLVDEVRGKA